VAELIAIAYKDQSRAATVLDALNELEEAGVVEIDEAVAFAKDSEGRFKVTGGRNNVKRGAASGAVIGTIIGAIFLVPVAGALFGVASGALGGKLANVSQIDEFTTTLGNNMTPGSSAIVMRGRSEQPQKLLEALSQFEGGTVIRTSLADDAEERVRAAIGEGAEASS
jgi:uncharacterized membrane protein